MHLQVIDSRAEDRYLELACYFPVENLDVPMMFQGTKPHSPRGSERVNVKTIGGRSYRYWCCRGPVRETNGRPSERYQAWGAPVFLYRW